MIVEKPRLTGLFVMKKTVKVKLNFQGKCNTCKIT